MSHLLVNEFIGATSGSYNYVLVLIYSVLNNYRIFVKKHQGGCFIRKRNLGSVTIGI